MISHRHGHAIPASLVVFLVDVINVAGDVDWWTHIFEGKLIKRVEQSPAVVFPRLNHV